MEYIDNVYVINMEESKDRLTAMNKQIPTLGKQFIRIDAINGKNLSSEDRKNATTFLCNNFCTPSMIGISMSHKKAWKTMIENGDRYAIIMEDDAELIPQFQSELQLCLDELMVKNKDWEFIYLGCFGACDKNKDYDFFEKV